MEATQTQTWPAQEARPQKGHDVAKPAYRQPYRPDPVPGSPLAALVAFVNVEGTPRPQMRDRLSRIVSNTFAFFNKEQKAI
jgi:hypothetical protein